MTYLRGLDDAQDHRWDLADLDADDLAAQAREDRIFEMTGTWPSVGTGDRVSLLAPNGTHHPEPSRSAPERDGTLDFTPGVTFPPAANPAPSRGEIVAFFAAIAFVYGLVFAGLAWLVVS